MRIPVTTVLAAILLSACGGGSTTTTPPSSSSGGLTNNTITGTVSLPAGTKSTPATEFIPGEVIVKFKPGLRPQGLSSLSVGGVQLTRTRTVMTTAGLYRTNTSPSETLELVQALQARVDVEYAEPNRLFRATKTPNDPLYASQWHYPAMKLPQAWDVVDGTQGTPVTVAVVDTGILWNGDNDPKTHPDFKGKVLPGFDMISDPRNSRDGDGRDTNAFDEGSFDLSATQSSYHGSHVAGTIAAATNNGGGVAGVSWGAKIVPVRVLGAGGVGSGLDIVEGMLWAAGVPVADAAENKNPAQVINMSLGGTGSCSQFEQDAINQARAKGAIIVVAAGNENADASNFSPASCSGVITVGATDFSGRRAPYSNFGARIDVMAPGGDVGIDDSGDGRIDGVLSISKNDETGELDFLYLQGTSMASPHVAGLIALMKARRSSLTSDEALRVLKQTAVARSDAQCRGRENGPQNADDCGAGLVDAFAAVSAISPGGGPTPGFSLNLSQGSVVIAPGGAGSVQLSLTCSGGFNGAVTVTISGAPQGVTSSIPTQPTCGGAAVPVNLTVAATVAANTYPLTLTGSSGGQTQTATLGLTVRAEGSGPNVKDTFVAALYYLNGNFDLNRSKGVFVAQGGSNAPYSVGPLVLGVYLVAGWKDVNGNGQVDSGDLFGMVNGGKPITPPKAGLNVTLAPVVKQTSSAQSNQIATMLEALRNSR